MKVLILGRNGMLEHVTYNYFKEKNYEVYGTVVDGRDGIMYDAYVSQEKLEKIIQEIKPNVVINCIGILNRVAEDNHHLAVSLNSLLPHYIDLLSEKYNFKLIHVSTDCVFKGDKGKYDESSLPDAISFYGRSKALGEVVNERNLTLRTSIIGPDNNPKGIGLFQWFITQSNSVDGYNKVIWTGVTTIELAKAIEKGIKNDLSGLHHVVNNDFISKRDLLVLFKSHFNKDIIIKENDSVISEKTLRRTEKSFNFEVPSYDDMIKEMKEWVLKHKSEYPLIMNNCNLRGESL